MRWLEGSTVSAVTRGTPTFGHSSAISAGSFCQCAPPSLERNSAAGLVPAKMMSGLTGSIAIRQTSRLFIGESRRSKLCPPSLLLWMPSLAPANTVRGSRGCTVSPKIRLSFPNPLPTRRQLSPPSGLSHAPLPTVPTQIVKLPVMAVSSHDDRHPCESGGPVQPLQSSPPLDSR